MNYTKSHFYLYDYSTQNILKLSLKKKEAKDWRKHQGSTWAGRTIRIGLKGNCLILNEHFDKVRILGVDEGQYKGVEFDFRIGNVEDSTNSELMDHQILGKNSDHVVTLTEMGLLSIFKLNVNLKTHEKIDEVQLKLRGARAEVAWTLAVNQKESIVAVYQRTGDFAGSRIQIFQIENMKSIAQKHEIDLLTEKLREFRAMMWSFRITNRLFLTAITASSPSEITTFIYDLDLGILTLENDLRKAINDGQPCYRLCQAKDANGVEGVDWEGRIIDISYNF